jgi:hypothetical protein
MTSVYTAPKQASRAISITLTHLLQAVSHPVEETRSIGILLKLNATNQAFDCFQKLFW